jgi:hypothetical protein
MRAETVREIAAARGGDGADQSLGTGARMLIHGVRRMAFGGDSCPITRREFAAALGASADDALAAFRCFFRAVAAFGRRRLAIGFPGAGTVTHDERLLVAVFAAAQANEQDRLAAHLRWLTAGGEHRVLAATAAVIGKALAAAGHDLAPPAPLSPAPISRPQLALTSFCRLRSPSGLG